MKRAPSHVARAIQRKREAAPRMYLLAWVFMAAAAVSGAFFYNRTAAGIFGGISCLLVLAIYLDSRIAVRAAVARDIAEAQQARDEARRQDEAAARMKRMRHES